MDSGLSQCYTELTLTYVQPLIGLAIWATGVMNIMTAVQLYAVDGFKFPASAFASLNFLRNLFAGAFPLFGPKLFDELGIDWGVGLLAFITLGVVIPLVTLVRFSLSVETHVR